MPRHCEDDGEHGRGTSRRHALKRMIVASPSPMAPFPAIALDTGDADEFSSSKAGGFACSRGLYPYEQGTVAITS